MYPNTKSKQADFTDPFNAGQMIGMLMMLLYVEENKGIDDGMLQRLKWLTAANAEEFLDKPAEDVLLIAQKHLKEAKI